MHLNDLASTFAARWLRAVALLILATVGGLAHAAPVDVTAEVIWNDDDARGKCPQLCTAKSLSWTGNWRKTTDWVPSYVCSCDAQAANRPGIERPQPQYPQNVRPQQQFLPGGSVTRYDYTDMRDTQPVRDFPPQTFEQCASACLADNQCGPFTFAANQQRCYLKSGHGNLQGAPQGFSGVVATRNVAGGGMPGQPALPSPSQGGSCGIASTQKCPGCSVACAAGQSPVCSNAVEGVTPWCARNAACSCK